MIGSLSGLTLLAGASILLVKLRPARALHVPDLEKRAVAYFNPLDGGGSLLDDTGNGLGEPLNVRLIPPLCVPSCLRSTTAAVGGRLVGKSKEVSSKLRSSLRKRVCVADTVYIR